MGAQLTKGGVAVEGKAAGDSAAAKTNGQVSILAGRHAYACMLFPTGITPSPNGSWLHSTLGTCITMVN